MAASEPEDLHRRWSERFSAGDVEGVMALYEPGASLAAQPGQILTGHEAIREALKGFLAITESFEMTEIKPAIRSGDIALLHSSWVLKGKAPDGSPVAMEGTTADVVRRQPDGRWLFVIDNPWGRG
jgi:uncharacterized protein (TIGR02246 family)